MISLGSAAISLGAMAYNVWYTQSTRKQDRVNRAPLLYASLTKVQRGPETQGQHVFHYIIRNTGTNPATNIKGHIIAVQELVEATNRLSIIGPVYPIDHPNELPNGHELSVNITLHSGLPRLNIRIRLEYEDGLTHSKYSKDYTFGWGGTENGALYNVDTEHNEWLDNALKNDEGHWMSLKSRSKSVL